MPLSDIKALEHSTSAVVVSSRQSTIPMGSVLSIESQGVYMAGSLVTDLSDITAIPFYQGLAPTTQTFPKVPVGSL